MQFQTLSVEGLRLRYAHQPKEGAPTLLLLSPFPQSIVAYAPMWQTLANSFNLFALDLPGFGRSEGGLAQMDIFVQAKLLGDAIDALGLENPHIVAPDVACPITLAYAAQTKKAASLMVGDGPATYPAQVGKAIDQMMNSAFWRFMYALNTRSFLSSTYKMCYRKYKPSEAELADYQYSYEGRLKLAMAWFATYHQALPKLHAQLHKIETPVKIFWGSQDVVVLPSTADDLHKVLAASEIQIFEGAGHFAYQDDAALFAQMVIDWVLGGGHRKWH